MKFLTISMQYSLIIVTQIGGLDENLERLNVQLFIKHKRPFLKQYFPGLHIEN